MYEYLITLTVDCHIANSLIHQWRFVAADNRLMILSWSQAMYGWLYCLILHKVQDQLRSCLPTTGSYLFAIRATWPSGSTTETSGLSFQTIASLLWHTSSEATFRAKTDEVNFTSLSSQTVMEWLFREGLKPQPLPTITVFIIAGVVFTVAVVVLLMREAREI